MKQKLLVILSRRGDICGECQYLTVYYSLSTDVAWPAKCFQHFLFAHSGLSPGWFLGKLLSAGTLISLSGLLPVLCFLALPPGNFHCAIRQILFTCLFAFDSALWPILQNASCSSEMSQLSPSPFIQLPVCFIHFWHLQWWNYLSTCIASQWLTVLCSPCFMENIQHLSNHLSLFLESLRLNNL